MNRVKDLQTKKFAKIIFLGGHQKYNYFTFLTNLKEGEYVLVETISGLKVGQFIEYYEQSSDERYPANKWIVSRLPEYDRFERVKVNNQMKSGDDFAAAIRDSFTGKLFVQHQGYLHTEHVVESMRLKRR